MTTIPQKPEHLSPENLTNWAHNIEYGTRRLYHARSIEDIKRFVAGEQKLKVLGTRHCFNHIADSNHSLLSLNSLDQRIELDLESQTVTVPGGMTYGQLCPSLHERGFALSNLASLPHISVVGACSTATHGSGEKNGNLATAVSALEFVTARGEIVRLSRQTDGQTFCGTVVGLGALGVITRITLEIQPTFGMRQTVYENLPFPAFMDHFDEIQACGYSVSLFTVWQGREFDAVWIKTRAEDKGDDLPQEFFGATLAAKNLSPIGGFPTENCTEQMGIAGPWHERLPHFRMGFIPSAGKELQTEYFVPRRHAIEAVLAVERLRDDITPHLLVSEIRTIAADELWLSPCYKQAGVAIHFTWKQNWEAVGKLLPAIERELAPFQPRPHWGKLFTLSPQQIEAAYERLPDFVQMCQRFDPQGKFRNKFLDTYIFGD